MAKTIIIHGWSDSSDSFQKLKAFLAKNGRPADTVLYADYESREDNFTFEDAADGLNDRFIQEGIIDRHGKKKDDIDVIVHSTGGLVIRHWLWRHYLNARFRPEECPVKRIVMLAPANFGSPLAHRGKSLIGSLVKGRWKVGDLFEVGQQLLNGLELASPYQWRLAEGDLLAKDSLYGADRIQVTVLVGGKDYDGLRGWVNKPGTDGTVVIAGTGLGSVKFVLDCCKPRGADGGYDPFTWSATRSAADCAFGVLAGFDHGSIVDDSDKPAVGDWILQALSADTPQKFRSLQADLAVETNMLYEKAAADAASSQKQKAADALQPYQQFIVRGIDDQEQPVRDFTLEFFLAPKSRLAGGLVVYTSPKTDAEERLSTRINEILTSEGHRHSIEGSYRRFLVPVQKVIRLLDAAKQELGDEPVLGLRAFVPEIDRRIKYDVAQIQDIPLHGGPGAGTRPSFLFENTTTLLEVKVNRMNQYVFLGKEPRKH